MSDVLPIQYCKVIKSDSKSVSGYRRVLHEDKVCDTLQGMTPIDAKTVHQTSLFHIESNPDRLGLLSPTHGQRSPKFLKAICHVDIRKNVVPRSMAVETLSW